MPTTAAVDRLRSRKSPRGISGAATRVSTTRKTSRSATASARRPSVVPDVHPSWFPFTIPYTATISAAVTVIAPPTSSPRPADAVPGVEGSSRIVRKTTATPIGRLTRKIQCQLIVSVSTPPRTTPMLPPPEATKPNSPIAFARSAGSVKSDIMSDSDTADATAPPTPWTARAPMSIPWDVERPHASDAIVNRAIPSRKSRRGP
jgi:hypothetical protein